MGSLSLSLSLNKDKDKDKEGGTCGVFWEGFGRTGQQGKTQERAQVYLWRVSFSKVYNHNMILLQ